MTTETNIPAIEIAIDAVKTISDPSVANIINDAELAISLVKKLKQSLEGTHPSIGKLVKSLLRELI